MPTDIPAGPSAYPTGRADPTFAGPIATESVVSGVSWGAIVAGGVAAAAMVMILGILGAGLGLISISPWPGQGASASTISVGVVVWSIIVELVAFGVGGYIAGRLRTKWANVHGDEVFFRDTAHGMITWALGTLVGVALVTSAAGHLARSGAEVGAAAAGGIAAGGAGAGMVAANDAGPRGPMGAGPRGGNPMDYYIDMLFRPAGPMPAANTTGNAGTATGTTTSGTTTGTATGTTTTDTGTAAAPTPAPAPTAGAPQPGPGGNDLGPVRAEIGRIVMNSIKDGQITISQTDHAYIGSLIAQRTGLSQQDAEKRLDEVVGQAKAAMDDIANKAKQAADDARKAGAALALWTFVSMLIGAFVASYAATVGGRHRDL
jgi:hypothetical protein